MLLLFVFVVATLNLAVGYALGAGLTFGTLREWAARREEESPPVEFDENEPPLTRPAPSVATPEAPAAETTDAARPTVEEPVGINEGLPPDKPIASPTDVMAKLGDFRKKLAAASIDLKANLEDRDRFESSASELRQANHDYLDLSEEAVRELGADGSEEAAATGSAVARGAEEVAQLSEKIDGLIDSGLDDRENRSALVGAAEQVEKSVAETEASVGAALSAEGQARQVLPPNEAVDEADAAVDPAADEAEEAEKAEGAEAEAEDEAPRDFASIDELLDKLESLLEGAEEETVRHVAAIRVDPIDEHEDDSELAEAIERSVAALTKELLAESHTFVPGRPAMALLDGDSFDEASERVERLRRQVEATVFQTAAGEVRATVTCALADARPNVGRDKVLEQINLALEESSRVGANQTIHHDGGFATPLTVETKAVKPRTVAV